MISEFYSQRWRTIYGMRIYDGTIGFLFGIGKVATKE